MLSSFYFPKDCVRTQKTVLFACVRTHILIYINKTPCFCQKVPLFVGHTRKRLYLCIVKRKQGVASE